ncbi:MAG: TetR/AcrR family transcriptional regulator, partial [bacterium]|nr:TetR/AcrR family transcriptional regulator [bacterium]
PMNATSPPPPTRPRAHHDAAATREALFEAATELFAERGFDGAKVEAIARRAGVNKAMISYHFGGKKGLYAAIVEATIDSFHERFAAVADESQPAAERLRRFVEGFAEVATRRPGFPAMMLREAVSGGRNLDKSVFQRMLQLFSLVRGIVEQGVREGSFRPVDPLLTHLSLIGSLVFFFSTMAVRERLLAVTQPPVEVPDPASYVHHIQELFVGGLAARGDRSADAETDSARRP